MVGIAFYVPPAHDYPSEEFLKTVAPVAPYDPEIGPDSELRFVILDAGPIQMSLTVAYDGLPSMVGLALGSLMVPVLTILAVVVLGGGSTGENLADHIRPDVAVSRACSLRRGCSARASMNATARERSPRW